MTWANRFDQWGDGLADQMAEHMGVATPTAARYRKVYDFLGLIVDYPGNHYVPEAATVTFLSRDQDAIEKATMGLTDIVTSPRYRDDLPNVAVRHSVSGWSAIPYGDEDPLSPASFVSSVLLNKKEHIEVVSNTDETNSKKSWNTPSTPSTPSTSWPREQGSRQVATERSEVVNQPLTKSLTVPDLMDRLGLSRAQTYRKIPELERAGILLKVKRGLWRLMV